jgi:hypothetical protein
LPLAPNKGEDVNGDGFKDLVRRFYAQRTGFQTGDVEGILRGWTTDQIPIEGRECGAHSEVGIRHF